MKKKTYDVWIYDCKLDDACIRAAVVNSDREAKRLVCSLENLGLYACYGIHPDYEVNGVCFYDED